VTNRPKKKGTEHESSVTKWFIQHGWPHAKRLVLKGNRDLGDVSLGDGVAVVVEAKNERAINLGAYIRELDIECLNAGFTQGVVIIKRRGTTDVGQYYVLTTVQRWNDLALRTIDVPAQRPRRRFRRVS
jgi:hypothetical protein